MYETSKPQDDYRARFRAELLKRAPQSVLDVGCGDGALLRALAEADIFSAGVEPDPAQCSAGRSAGFEIIEGLAEQLPFEDRTFDWVVSEFCAHHFSDFAAALGEARRVARRGVAILDQWFDPALPGHAAASAFDNWCKRIDRSRGMVHNPAQTLADVCGYFHETGEWTGLEIGTAFIHIPIPADELDRRGRAHGAPDAQLSRIVENARRESASEDGALIVFAGLEE